MTNPDQKEKERAAREWLMRPLYNIMILALVILELLGKQIDEGTRNGFHIVLWVALGSVVMLHIIAFMIRVTESKSKGEGEGEGESEKNL
jgi:fatty-acid desaturase